MIPGMTESTQTNLSTEVVENTPSPSFGWKMYIKKEIPYRALPET